MEKSSDYKIPADYNIVLFICAFLIIYGFILDSPAKILDGLFEIITSRSVLVTDYVALGGVGAALVNASISGFFFLILLIKYKVPSTGRITLALFLTIGFSLFGKNIVNMLPIFFGVWLYGKACKIDFKKLFVQAMVSGTVSPVVSEIAFFDENIGLIRGLLACIVGLFIGFIFPVLMEASKRMHRGYNLYNGGVTGGFIATFFVGVFFALGIEIVPENFWDTEHTAVLAIFSFIIGFSLVIYGLVMDKPVPAFKKYRELLKERDIEHNDYLAKYGSTCYINIGILCVVTTGLMLLLRIPINGPVLGGILTVTGFAAAGKHLRNTVPVLVGSTLGTYFNFIDTNSSANALAILFSTGLAPISGKYGWYWGIATGFIHVLFAVIIGNLNGGLNLYNNGFAGGFVALIFVPLIVFVKEIIYHKKKVDRRKSKEDRRRNREDRRVVIDIEEMQ